MMVEHATSSAHTACSRRCTTRVSAAAATPQGWNASKYRLRTICAPRCKTSLIVARAAEPGDNRSRPGEGSGASRNDGTRNRSGADGPPSDWDSWEEWGPVNKDWVGDWEPWDAEDAANAGQRKFPRRFSARGRPRDEYLRPIVDWPGIRDRLSADSLSTEERIVEEFSGNRDDSREAIKFGAKLIGIPLVVGFLISRLLAAPILSTAEQFSDNAWALTDHQKIEGAHEVHAEELRLRMEAAIGRTTELSPPELQAHLRAEAKHLVVKFKEANKRAFLNLVSDSISGSVFFTILITNREGRTLLLRTLGRVFSGLSDTAKAFIIIAVTDILLGYHSEDGWTAAIRLVSDHYGYEVEEGPIYIFVATVPVFLDSLFKFWIFTGLNRIDPAAAVTLKNMDRH